MKGMECHLSGALLQNDLFAGWRVGTCPIVGKDLRNLLIKKLTAGVKSSSCLKYKDTFYR